MKLSVIIPAHNEAKIIVHTVTEIHLTLKDEFIEHEILVINDNSNDTTEKELIGVGKYINELRYINNDPPNGFGYAIRLGLEHFKGDAVAIMMADSSDSPKDLVKFYRLLAEGNFDCVFGNRWGKEGKVFDYPKHKLFLNRVVNWAIKIIFGLTYSDTTNAFKMYHARVIPYLMPLLSPHFNITVELPLKATIRGFSYGVVPNTWTNRTVGVSKLKIREMGSRYAFIIIYCFIEKWLSRGDYHVSNQKIRTKALTYTHRI